MGRGVALLFHDRDTRRGEWSAARPGRTLPPGKTRYPLYRRLSGRQDRSGRAENLAPPEFDPRTVQPVAQSLYRLRYPAQKSLHAEGLKKENCKSADFIDPHRKYN